MSSRVKNILDLPYEINVLICKYLPYSDIKVLRHVCKKFYDVCVDDAIIRNETFTMTKYRVEKDPELSILTNSNRIYRNFRFEDVDVNNNYGLILEKFKEYVHSITIDNCSMLDHEFLNILSGCRALKSLTLKSCEDALRSGVFPSELQLSNLRHIKFVASRYVTDKIVSQIINFCPRLQSLAFSDCYINFHSGVTSYFYHNQETVLEKPCVIGLTFRCILEVLALRASFIKSLDFSSTHIKSDTLKEICEINDLKLEHLNLSNCKELKFRDLCIGTWQPNLTELILSDCDTVTDFTIIDVCTKAANLKLLNIAGCTRITNESIEYFNKLKNIQHINISRCKKISVKQLVNNIGWESPMTEFIANNVYLENSDVIIIASTFRNLSELNLANCGVSSFPLIVTLQNQRKLKKLNLSNNKELFDLWAEDFGNPQILTRNTDVEYMSTYILGVLKDSNSFSITSMESSNFFKQIYDAILTSASNVTVRVQLKNYENLTALDLSNCFSLSEQIISLFSAFKHLNELKIPNTNMSDFGLVYICLNCRNIEFLNISGCIRITDAGIYFVVRYLHRLSKLMVANCKNLTDATIHFILHYCKSLNDIDISHCNITRRMVLELERLPSMYKITSIMEESPFEIVRIS